jgi:hypothetical protein
MEKGKLLECVAFFNKLNVTEHDITTDEERANGQFVVTVDYQFEDKAYQTQKLYYKSISGLDNIKNKQILINYFGDPVYWLDIEKHDWPKGSGESDLEKIVVNEMAPENDDNFKVFLKILAQNNQSGYIQKITEEGRSGQYYHNLENNNHWHDLILLIKAIIASGGQEVDKKYFSRLVFKWDGGKNSSRDRSTLTNKAYHCDRSLIDCLYKNIKSIQMELKETNSIELLKYKKQIILQGPPGTGKTRKAKEIARNLCLPSDISIDQIKQLIVPGLTIRSVRDYVDYKIIRLDDPGIKIQNETGNTSNSTYSDIIQEYHNKSWLNGTILNGSQSIAAAIAKYIFEHLEDNKFKLIQFHPAYSYEDFVRGITAKLNGTQVEYKTENKVLAKFALKALNNYQDSKKTRQTLSKEKWLINELNLFAETVQEAIDMEVNGRFPINETVSIFGVDDDAFRYCGNTWAVSNMQRMKFSDIVLAQLGNAQNRQEIKVIPGISGRAKEHSSYDFKLLEKFRAFLAARPPFVEQDVQIQLQNFVLIIDEINRANLPAVLGELIYALEYRGESIESMYDIDGDQNFILPPNLYIIGTMNTADRSVGHIDYAIRRRFAFVDVLPSTAPIHPLAKALFKKVSELFIKNYDTMDWNNPIPERSEYLASDFRPEDIWIGHSYFISDKATDNEAKTELRLKRDFEIVPLLKEYLKDGILLEKATDKIKEIKDFAI